MHRALPLILLLTACSSSVIQRLPEAPSADNPDPIAREEADRVTVTPQWAGLRQVYARLATLAPSADYGRREDAVEAVLADLKSVEQALTAARALHPLTALDLHNMVEELARQRVSPTVTDAQLSPRQRERRAAVARFGAFLDALSAGEGPESAAACCDLLLTVDMMKFRRVSPCNMPTRPGDEFLPRLPLDVRVATEILRRLAVTPAP